MMKMNFTFQFELFPQFQGTATLNGIRCTKWMAGIQVYGKNDTYIFYATDELNPRPVRFEMQGYDILLTSYYDHYIVDYNNFTTWIYDSDTFNIPQGIRLKLLFPFFQESTHCSVRTYSFQTFTKPK